MSDYYYEWKERMKAFAGTERTCDECGLVFFARTVNQFCCDDPECRHMRTINKQAAINYELKKSVIANSRRNPLFPSPSDLLFIQDTF